ncbi:MAG TPA: carbohydrate kinase family protein [Bryobacteraceae bacterium]
MIEIPGAILVSGNLVHDIVVRPASEIRFGGTIWVDRIEQHMGGNGASTSYAAALLGAPVRLIGMIGDDDFGLQIRTRLASAGVDVSLLATNVEHGTASSVVIVREDGARAFLHKPGVSSVAFAPPFSITQASAAGCSHYHLANPYSLPHVRPIAGRLLREAKELGLTTSLDTAWDSRGEWMQVLEPCLAHLDLLFVNEEEARLLTGADDPESAARHFLNAGAGSVVIKLGARGAVVFGKDRLDVPAHVVDAADTTGAGDCFAGALLAGLYHGYPPRRAMQLANAAGALSVSRVGATSGLLPLAETLDWAASSSPTPCR